MSNRDAAPPPAVPCLPTLFQEELARAGALPGHAAATDTLWPRFAGFYRALARLPRKARRALQRRWRRSLAGLAFLLALGQAPALAATISVGGGCNLVDAITAANSDAQTGGCTAGSGTDTLALPAQSTHTLVTVNNSTHGPTGLPVITSELTIDGNLSTITRDSALEFRILAVGDSGNLTLQDTKVSGGAAPEGGGIDNAGILTLRNSTVEGNSAYVGGGIDNSGSLTLTDSFILSNTAAFAAGIRNIGTLALTTSTVAGNEARYDGGGARNYGTLILSGSTVAGNTVGTGNTGGGIDNGGMLILENSTVEANTAHVGGGVDNAGTLTVTNSTISGNTAGDRGGGVYSINAMSLTSSTVSGNASGRLAGGLFNKGSLTLVQTLISGNTAPVIGPEAYNVSGTVIGDSHNIFGHDGFSGVAGFTRGVTDLVPGVPLSAVLDPTLGYNGGPNRTHTLVFGSPAVDAVPGASCATSVDQRGEPRPQDADGDTIPDCDIGAVERGVIPIQAEITSTTLNCGATACRVSVRCNLLETDCANRINITVRTAAVRAADGTLLKTPRRFRFAGGVANVPSGGTQTMRLRLTRRGKQAVGTTKNRRLKGVLAINEIPATATATNTPIISRSDVTLRLRRRR